MGIPRDLNQAQFWYRRAADQGHLAGRTGMAWLLSTATNSALRNPQAAVRYAEKAAELTLHTNAFVLDALATAYAAAGQAKDAALVRERLGKLPQ